MNIVLHVVSFVPLC